jgi:putative transposase
VTLAIHFFLPGDTMVDVLETLMRRVEALGIRSRRLFLEKGFAGIEVMEHLKRRRQPTVIACPIRGKTGGTRALCTGNKSYRTTHTFKNVHSSFTAELAVCRMFTRPSVRDG